MEEKKEQHPPVPQPQYVYLQPPLYQDDEISLIDLWLVLRRRWLWIAGGLVLAVAAAAFYLMATTPIYEAEAVLLPPEERYVQSLSVINTPGVATPDRKELYQEFVANLKSSSLRRRFFDENNLLTMLAGEEALSADRVFQSRFNQHLQVRDGGRNQGDFVYLSMQGPKPELLTAWINDFIDLAARHTTESIVEGLTVRIQNQKTNINEDIRIDREFARQRIEDRLALLEENIVIAQALNIFTRDDKPLRTLEGSTFGVAVTTSGEPLYTRGVKDLTAEKEALESREVLDPFISGLRDKQAKLESLDSQLRLLQIAKDEATPAKIDRPAVVPEHSVQPRKNLVLALSLALGGMLGVFAAFFHEFIAKARKETK